MKALGGRFFSLLGALASFRVYGTWRVKDAYDAMYAGQQKSPTLRSLARRHYADAELERIDPLSFITTPELAEIADLLELSPGRSLVDLACGRGGPGLYLAERSGAALVGLDLSPKGAAEAAARAGDFKLAARPLHYAADMRATGLPGARFDAALCIDSLWLVPDPGAAVREIRRILRPGGRLALTTWEAELPFMVRDWGKFLEKRSFKLILRRETPGWQERMKAMYRGLLEERRSVEEEMGPAAKPLLREARVARAFLPRLRRVLVAAGVPE